VFLINVPLGLLAGVLARLHLQESTSPETGARPGWPGITLLTLGTGTLAWGIVRSESAGWVLRLAALLAVAGLLLAFGLWARGRPAAARDLTLFEDRSFLFVNLATPVFGITLAAMFLSAFFGPPAHRNQLLNLHGKLLGDQSDQCTYGDRDEAHCRVENGQGAGTRQ